MNQPNIEYQSHILPNNDLNYLAWVGEEKVMSHYIQYKLLPFREQVTVYRQTESIVEELRS